MRGARPSLQVVTVLWDYIITMLHSVVTEQQKTTNLLALKWLKVVSLQGSLRKRAVGFAPFEIRDLV